MGNSFLDKEQNEVPKNQLLAYVLAKIKPFEWVRINMFHEENQFLYPPSFNWRYHDCEESIYAKIFECIHEFKGNVEWTMYKVTRNFTIEPSQFHIIRLTEGSSKLESVLKDQYPDYVSKAIDDIPMLCSYIEDTFGIGSRKPFAPIIADK